MTVKTGLQPQDPNQNDLEELKYYYFALGSLYFLLGILYLLISIAKM